MPLNWIFLTSTCIGFYKVMRGSTSFASFLWRHMFRGLLQAKDRNYRRYGRTDTTSWAVVTGGSDGIGLAVCHKLAKEGFNICIVSRNLEKINEKLEEVKAACIAENPTIQTMAIQADFSEMKTIDDYERVIAEPLKNLDVAVLVANAGMGLMAPFADLTNKEVESLYSINTTHVIFTIKVLLENMIQRHNQHGKRSAILVTSSVLGTLPLSGTITYSASKSFVSFLAQGLNYELKNKVDVISFEPGEVETKMLSGHKGRGMITPQ